MYFPYLRGRQFELIALRELLEKNLIGDKIVPIIEPIKVTPTLLSTLEIYCRNNHRLIMVMNPGVGEFVKRIKEERNNGSLLAENLDLVIKDNNVTRAYIMKRTTPKLLRTKNYLENYAIINTSRDALDYFLEVYNDIEPCYSLIPYDRTFSRKAPNSKVIFEDKFNKATRNADYLLNIDEFYSDDHLFFGTEGYKGFADYSIVGSDYNESGFAPSAVAIHIVYFDKSKNLRVHHFVSSSNEDIKDPAGKFGEALNKLCVWIDSHEVHMTEGLKLFKECHVDGRYPGLGTVKKYSIMHHIELVNNFLEGKL